MRVRAAFFGLIAGLIATAALAQSQRELTLFGGGVKFDPATIAWVNAVKTAGGVVSQAQTSRVNNLIVALKAKYTTNYFTKCDRIWLHASENTQQATIDIVNRSALTPHNSPTFTANKGYTGNASNKYLDTGFQTGANFSPGTTTGASFGSYVLSNRTIGNQYFSLGATAAGDTGPLVGLQPLGGGGPNVYFGLGSNIGAYAYTTSKGFWRVTAKYSTANAILYLNGSAVTTGTPAGAAVPFNIALLAANDAGTIDSYSSDQIAETDFCGYQTATQEGQFQSIINTYMTSIGANVY